MKTAKFKDSPLGPIPHDWEVKRLGKICDVQLGKMLDSAKNQGEECFYLTNKDVQWGRISVSDLRRMRMSEDDRQRFSLRQGDLLVCEGGEVGRCAIWNSEVEGCCFQKTIHRVRANVSDTIDMRFLQPLLCVYAKKGVFDPYISCTSIAHLTKEKFELLEIICPPVPEQQRIAEALGEVDKLIESLDEQIEKKRLIAKGVAHDLLSGKKRLPGFKGAWRCAHLGTLVDFITDTIATKDIDTRKYVSTDNMLSNLAGVTPNKSIVPYASVREFKSGDILLSNIRPYLKKMWFADYDAGCSTDVLVLRVVADLIDSRFLYRVLARDTFFEFVSAKAVGTKMPRGDKRVIAVFQVPIPQLAEQQAIADLLGEQDAAIAVLEEKREKYARIKEGMMRDLLTGKVRMKGE